MRVGIICRLDGAANSVRPTEIGRFLTARGHEVQLINVADREFSSKWFFRRARLRNLLIAGTDRISYIVETTRLKANVLEREIRRCGFDAIICECPDCSYVLTKKLGCTTIFDCPTPWTAELRVSPEYGVGSEDIDELAALEREVYEKADYVAFHWETYADFVRKHVYEGKNIITLNWGCHPKASRSRFESPPRIAFLGKLSHSWVDLPLLEHLVDASGNIDVYGIPEPQNADKLNYKGYATPDVLSEYQFGLVTTNREWREKFKCHGFSAKHVEYLSYGLPVLEPEWRDIPGLTETSIPYNEDNFVEQVQRYSDPRLWQEKSDEAYELAKSLDWNITLQPLADIIR